MFCRVAAVRCVIDGSLPAEHKGFRKDPVEDAVRCFRLGRRGDCSACPSAVGTSLRRFCKIEEAILSGKSAVAPVIRDIMERDIVLNSTRTAQEQPLLRCIQCKAAIGLDLRVFLGAENDCDPAGREDLIR